MLKKKYTALSLFAVAAVAAVIGCMVGQTAKQADEPTSALAQDEGSAKSPRRNSYFPNTEKLAPDEMRVISCGTGMPTSRPSQAAACWLVELGNGQKFIFDIGSGSAERLAALEIPWNDLNKVFVSHLHSDHVGDFAAVYIGGWVGQRVNPLRIWGPNSSKPEWGTKHFVDHQVAAYQWDLDGRKGNLQSRGAQIEVNEVPHDRYAVVYEEDGVKIAAWPAIHILEGCISYSLEWNGRKFVFSGDTFPNKWFIKYSKNADVLVHETFFTTQQWIDKANANRINAAVATNRIHTPPAAAGKVFSMLKPRMAVAYHFFNDYDTRYDIYDEIRRTYDGPLTLATDYMVWNVTNEGVEVREVIFNESVWNAEPNVTVPPPDFSERLTPKPWLWQGSLKEIEPTIKAIYERMGVGDLYESQTPEALSRPRQ